jgi:hypothetical protein
MKRAKDIKELKIERPPRAKVSEKDALKRMKEFSKRKEQFLATARTGKGRRYVPDCRPPRTQTPRGFEPDCLNADFLLK